MKKMKKLDYLEVLQNVTYSSTFSLINTVTSMSRVTAASAGHLSWSIEHIFLSCPYAITPVMRVGKTHSVFPFST